MRVMVILDHPWRGSFCHALKDAVVRGLAAAGHERDVLDLHRENFDPVLRVDELAVYAQGTYLDPKVGEYQQRIEQAQHLLFIFPLWWEVMPAMLKGWLDKVFLPEWAFTEADALPLLTHITGATAITTMGAPEITYNSVERVLLKGTLGFCGIKQTCYINFLDVGNANLEQRQQWLNEVESYARQLA
jgi:NAD(P)H dehydrogenase (quinone)